MNRTEHLRTLLQALTPADALEETHRAALLGLSHAEGDPFARDHWSPGHFTASAFVESPDGSELLLIFHEKLQRWLQPGGHVEPSDVDVIAAALREVAEETGITDVEPVGAGLFDVDVHEIPARKGDPTHRHFDARIRLRARTRAAEVGDGVLGVRWVKFADVASIDTDESVLRAVRKLTSAR